MSDMYPYIFWLQVYGGDDSDIDSPGENQTSVTNLNSVKDSNAQLNEQDLLKKSNENSFTENDSPSIHPTSESHQSMGDILSAIDSGLSLPVAGPELCAEKPINKLNGSNSNIKRSTFWGRNNVSYCYPFVELGPCYDEETCSQYPFFFSPLLENIS